MRITAHRKRARFNPRRANMLLALLIMAITLAMALITWLAVVFVPRLKGPPQFRAKLNELCRRQNASSFYFEDLKLIREQVREYGYNIMQSERICLQRELPDLRHKNCSRQTPEKLPGVSVIMAYNRLDLSALLRAILSIKDRTPPELLQQLILVDDASERPELSSPKLKSYLQDELGNKLKLLRLPEHVGSWAARLEGAKLATAEVLVFVEPYVEVGVDWLPALLLPIQANARVSTMPLINNIDYATLKYLVGKAKRLAFDWDLHLVELELRAEDRANYPAPFETPLLSGEVLAIGRAWFFQLGAYQVQLFNPRAVQLELSFKQWLCGGRVLQVPCSHVGYLQRQPEGITREQMDLDSYMDQYMSFKDLLEVWFDDYKQVIYEHTDILRHLQPDELRAQRVLRRRLHCKPAAHFFKHVAPEIVASNPFELPEDYAHGEISMLAAPHLCLSTDPIKNSTMSLRLRACKLSKNGRIASRQYWALGIDGDLYQGGRCLEVRRQVPNAKVLLRPCNYASSYQFWYYDYVKQRLEFGDLGNQRRCLEARPKESRVVMNDCKEELPLQKWTITSVDTEGLDSFFDQFPNEGDSEGQELNA